MSGTIVMMNMNTIRTESLVSTSKFFPLSIVCSNNQNEISDARRNECGRVPCVAKD